MVNKTGLATLASGEKKTEEGKLSEIKRGTSLVLWKNTL